MSGASPDSRTGRGIGAELAGWLSLGAAPTFAAMAVLTWAFGGLGATMCANPWFPLGGMAPMYWLMAAFHLSPWLRLADSGRPLNQAGDA
ncbi:MAG: hypothetical protein ACXW3O_02130 [Brevundimonas sp.]